MTNTNLSADINNLIELILSVVVKSAHPFFDIGAVPSYRSNKYWWYKRPDNAVFYNAWILKILQENNAYFSGNSLKKVNDYEESVIKLFDKYQHPFNQITYNFYPTKPSKHFGNGLVFRHFKHFQLTDDADDTAIIYSCLEKVPFEALNKLLEHHSKGDVRSLLPAHKNKRLFSTWFGVKMPLEYDLVVLCNILCLFATKKQTLTEMGKASLDFVLEEIEKENYLIDPYAASPHYANSVVIAYHLARLVEQYPNAASKNSLKQQLNTMAAEPQNNAMYKILISISLMRLGEKPLEVESVSEQDMESFSFFMAGLLTAYPQAWIHRFKRNSFFHIKWTCKAHSLALVLEYEALKNNYKR
jgi:hypothetical protein